jgi:ubiquinone/menaquinone biosynthesis C-methylase UbiE
MTDESRDAASYGELLADEYDAIYGDVFDTDGAVDRLAGLAGGGRVLEFGVGTGRIALPLTERGLDVWGIDGSPEMLKLLKEKPGGDGVTTLSSRPGSPIHRGEMLWV